MGYAGSPAVAAVGPAASITALATVPWPLPAGTVVVDTRPRAVCLRRSVAGGLCLAPGMFLGPRGRLVSWRNIRWLLGTMRLTGTETAVVAGDDATADDFVAGILYIAGQGRVEVAAHPLTAWLARHPRATGSGTTRGVFREAIYTAWPRTRLIVLRRELQRLVRGGLGAYLLDGRPPGRYRGVRGTRPRGGHIPGAVSLPMDDLGPVSAAKAVPAAKTRPVIAYGARPYESVAYFARLWMLGVRARVFIGGWRDWAAHARGVAMQRKNRSTAPSHPVEVLAAASAGAALMMLIWRMMRRR